ncbi:pedal peptide protein [Trichuris trichiura]|uniref:Pedal peptide protein n=1 Tax=Trichuris trichiura TaxID=36087 RepID=A0A077YZE1_TRITR|nr:pedal peptide protein [Trichuris trichiura]
MPFLSFHTQYKHASSAACNSILLQVHQIKTVSDWRFDDIDGNEERARMELANFYKPLGHKKQQFERIVSTNRLPGLDKKTFDRLDDAHLSGLSKRDFDSMEGVGLGNFHKRPFDSLERGLPGSWKRFIHRHHVVY